MARCASAPPCTHREVERSPLVLDGWPELARLEGHLANIRVRSIGTLGGNLSFADSHSDPATFLLAADARVIIGGDDGRRSVPIAEFTTGPYETALRAGEVLVAVEVPAICDGAAMVHHRFAFHERPAATVSCLVRVRDGHITEAGSQSVPWVCVRCACRTRAHMPSAAVGRARRGSAGAVRPDRRRRQRARHGFQWLRRVQAPPRGRHGRAMHPGGGDACGCARHRGSVKESSAMDQALLAAVAARRPLIDHTVRFINANPELAHEERVCSAHLQRTFATLGLEVEAGLAGWRPAFGRRSRVPGRVGRWASWRSTTRSRPCPPRAASRRSTPAVTARSRAASWGRSQHSRRCVTSWRVGSWSWAALRTRSRTRHRGPRQWQDVQRGCGRLG